MKSLSCVRLLATPWTAAYQAPLSMGFSRQEYWSGVPSPSPHLSTRWMEFWHKQCDSILSTTALYSYLVLTWVYKRDTYAQRQGATNTIAKSQALLGGLSTLSNHFHTPASRGPLTFSPQQKSKCLHITEPHDLSQTAGTVTMESMISTALLYLLFWINLFLPHSCISPFGFHLLII